MKMVLIAGAIRYAKLNPLVFTEIAFNSEFGQCFYKYYLLEIKRGSKFNETFTKQRQIEMLVLITAERVSFTSYLQITRLTF